MKRLFIFTYPKLTLYIIATFVAYFIFQIPAVVLFFRGVEGLSYIAIFLGGLLYSAGFTAPIATGFFLSLNDYSFLRYAIIGGFGALIADLGIFSLVRISFMDEFKKLEHTSFVSHIIKFFHKFSGKVRIFFIYIFAFLIISSPLPDEIAIALLAGFTKIHPYAFVFVSFFANTFGIFTLLSF